MNTHTADNRRMPDALREHLMVDERAELEQVWNVLEDIRPQHSVTSSDVEARLQHVKQRIARQQRRRLNDRPSMRSPRSRATTKHWVGLVSLVMLVGFLWYWQQPVVLHAGEGGLLVATLPDGSSVELNSGASLRYARQFSLVPGWEEAERKVYLNGEAFFDVTHQERPFRVETFNATVEVLGTQFNVRAWEDDAQSNTTVTLASGSVRLLAKEAKALPVLLKDGEVSRVDDAMYAPSAPEVATLDRALVWRSRGFAFSNQDLQAVFEELERRYSVAVRTNEPSIAELRTTAYYPAPKGVEAILEDLCATNALAYRITSTGYEVYRPQP